MIEQEQLVEREATREETKVFVEYINEGMDTIDSLIDECYDRFYDHDRPRLGELDAEVTLVNVPEVGAVAAEAVLSSSVGEVVEQPLLAECVKQSVMSLELPPLPLDESSLRFTVRYVEREADTAAPTDAEGEEQMLLDLLEAR